MVSCRRVDGRNVCSEPRLMVGRLIAILGRLIRDMRDRPGMLGSVKARNSSSPAKAKVLRVYRKGIYSLLNSLPSRRIAGIKGTLFNTDAIGTDGGLALGLDADGKMAMSRVSTRLSANS